MKSRSNRKPSFLARLCLALILAATLAPGQLPPALFTGTIHGISKKQVTIETDAGNLLDFDFNKKTQVLRGKKKIAAEELHTGDEVTIEAKREIGQDLLAVTITASGTSNK